VLAGGLCPKAGIPNAAGSVWLGGAESTPLLGAVAWRGRVDAEDSERGSGERGFGGECTFRLRGAKKERCVGITRQREERERHT
jgi:hypothetical protein